MKLEITYRAINTGEEEKACRLIMDCFHEFVAPGYSQEGITEFSKYVTPPSMKRRLAKNHSVILAMNRSEIIGVIEVRNYNHISLFFMKKQYQNKGIGKKLNELAVNNCRQNRPDVTGIEVHSSPYAVPIYEKLGFVKLGAERIENGMRFAPMMLNL